MRVRLFCKRCSSESAKQMSLATFSATVMSIGLIVHVRNLQMAEGTLRGTIAWQESTRAAEFGLLITILTAPGLILAAVLLA